MEKHTGTCMEAGCEYIEALGLRAWPMEILQGWASRFCKLGVFPNLVQVGAAAAQHPYFRVPPGILLPWWSQTVLEGIGGLKYKSRNWYPLFCLDQAASVAPTIQMLHLELDLEIHVLSLGHC